MDKKVFTILMILAAVNTTRAAKLEKGLSEEKIQTEVYKVSMDGHNRPVVLLYDPEGERYLPIWIGACEANSITRKLKGTTFSRPLTHDLFALVLETTGTKITHILVDQLRPLVGNGEGGVFFAVLTVERPDGTVHRIDSRSSDAIALAVRMDLPVFVARQILEDNGIPDAGERHDLPEDGPTDEKSPKGYY